jgi:TonB-linked SusC/RagA family outer membrane protein
MKNKKIKTLFTLTFIFLSMGALAGQKQSPFLRIFHEKQQSDQVPDHKIMITGRVVDVKGEPIIGATIKMEGSSQGTVTDLDGKFSINTLNNSVLDISYIGYNSQTIKVGGQRNLLVVLKENSQNLNEVVVVGFGTQKRESITGAISSISGNDLLKNNNATTSSALAGKIAGINSRQSDGRPGNGTSIRIRGMDTPLYVIDGVQKDEGQFNNIDPNDIESISILKDASAAIYGMRAANGVVVVTTRSGKRNTPNTINVNMYWGYQNLFKFPKPADTKTYVTAKYQSDVIRKSMDPNFNVEWTPEEYKKWMQGTEKGYLGWNWFDYIFKGAPMDYIEANMQGGSDKINYYIGLSHLNQDAIIKNYGGFYRTNLQMNITANLNSKLKIGANMNGRIEQRKNPGVPGGDDYWTAIYAAYHNLPTIRPYANDNPKYPALTSASNSTNFAMLNYDLSGRYENTWRVIQLNLTADYEIVKDLTLKGNVGYYFAYNNLFNHEFTYKLYGYNEKDDAYYVASSMDNPWMERTYANVEEYNGQLTANYKKTFFTDHHFEVTLGGEFLKRKTPSIWLHDRPASNVINQFHINTLAELSNSMDNPQARAGFINRFNYNYKEKYLLEFIGRYDGSWKFPPKHRWGFFPSISAGWRISEENFWSKIRPVISNLKLRISYGQVGDDNTPGYNAFDYLSGYNYGSGSAVIDGQLIVGSNSRGLAVKTLSWMKADMFNIGADFDLFGDRLSGEFNYFTKKTTGIPASRYDVLIPTEVGFSLPNENLNSSMIKGFDGSLQYKDNLEDFNYTVGTNFTFSRLYDWEQYKPKFGNSWDYYRNSINKRYAYIPWGKQVIGQFQSWEEIAEYKVDVDGKGNSTLRPGDFIYKDVNGDGVINGMDDRPIGYRQGYTPYLNFNFVFNFEYKGFDLGLTFTGATFQSFYMDWEMRNPLHDGGNNPQFYLSDQWHLSNINDANSTLVPGKYPTIIEGNSSHSNYWYNDFWLKNEIYMKLRNLEFGYNIPSKLLKRINIEKARFYVSMQNVFSIDNLGKVDIDEEIDSSNGLQYPTNKVISFGCNLTF